MNKKRIITVMMAALMIGITFTLSGCSIGGNKQAEISISSEKDIGSISEYNVYVPNDKANNREQLEKFVQEIVDTKVSEQKGILVKFYEYEFESQYGGTVPYAVGAWAPEEGLDAAYTQLNSRNNKVKVEYSQGKDVDINNNELELIEKILTEDKDKGLTFNQTCTLYYLEHQEEIINDYGLEVEDFTKLIDDFANRYDTDALQIIKSGE